MAIDSALVSLVGVTLFHIQKLHPAVDPAGILRQSLEQVKFNWRQGNDFSIALHQTFLNIYRQFSNSHYVFCRLPSLEATEHRFDPRHQFLRVEWFRDVVVSAQFETY